MGLNQCNVICGTNNQTVFYGKSILNPGPFSGLFKGVTEYANYGIG